MLYELQKPVKNLKIKTVGIYSKEDESFITSRFYDEKYFLSDDPLTGSYLDKDKIIKICKELNVDAVHPGYGFLSENYSFSSLLEKNNIIFIGPPASAVKKWVIKFLQRKLL